MQCLIDLDLLLYEVAFAGQFKEEGSDEIIPRPFDDVALFLEERIQQIEDSCWATEPSILYYTGSTNFRNDIAKKKPYKGNRKTPKPFHHGNLKAYARAKYDCRMQEGLEADDLMAIEQTSRLALEDTIICTRDKDLRMVEGFHYGWEVGNQSGFGPAKVDKLGEIELVNGKKVVGTGLRFFYSQLVTGDAVDNIMGLPKGGPVLAYNTLNGCGTEQEMFDAVSQLYKDKYEEAWEEEMLEMGQLLWMVRELNDDGSPVMWRFPDGA